MLRKLFGRRDSDTSDAADAEPEIAAREHHKAFELRAAPIHERGVWRVAGSIVRAESDDQAPQEFVRADTYASRDDAVAVSLRKARQIVDEQEAMAPR